MVKEGYDFHHMDENTSSPEPKSGRSLWLWLIIGILLIVFGGWWYARTSTPLPPPPEDEITIDPADLPPPPNLCMGAATATTTAYQRPSTDAGVFGELAPNDIVPIGAKTADGWLGFDPMSAQAANVGIFRLRWVEATSSVVLTPECEDIPVVPTLNPTACYVMVASETPVYESRSASSSSLGTLSAEGYALALSRSMDSWVGIEWEAGGTAWLSPDAYNLNGECELPIVE